MSIERRQFLKRGAALLSTPVLLGTSLATARADDAPQAVHERFPSQDPALVRDMVGASHGNMARVAELLKMDPAFAKATWDWGFGDWETALGAASHVGNREIAALLMENGARPDIFTFAMLGHLAAVRGMVESQPGVQRIHGPHGLTLLHHARKGGEPSREVVLYLESLGDADKGYVTAPLADDQKVACVGDYAFGSGAGDVMRVSVMKDGALGIARQPDGTTRNLFHVGGLEFHPPGNAAARIRFTIGSGSPARLVITDGSKALEATRTIRE